MYICILQILIPNFLGYWITKGNKYLYRVSAENEAGVSDPSEILGPLTADDADRNGYFIVRFGNST